MFMKVKKFNEMESINELQHTIIHSKAIYDLVLSNISNGDNDFDG